MTSWTDVINYVRTRYEVLEESDDWLRFRLDTTGGRTQQVALHHVPEGDGGAWLEISSAVGRADAIDQGRLLELAGTSLVGGAAVVDGVALLKHTVPLEHLSVREEFERPLALLVSNADAFEHQLTEDDHF
ncbi:MULTISPECIES: hypothetical protein [Saccharothrix]|uniref:Immunity protein 10 of polymorphic toxin system n=2 Tax=Saccharothrix TaxID=2071 RepID=A0ABU0X824_9PSEU|nr:MULTISPECIES: hypothetical protein [Saccharothrix]MDQ2588280.1 hypothetical protein [Saccharothrix yanglingensis]MDR6593963.1 hypothetical protein [Saccharothrix longispora]